MNRSIIPNAHNPALEVLDEPNTSTGSVVVAHILSRIDGRHLGVVINPSVARVLEYALLFDIMLEVRPVRAKEASDE